MSKYLDKNLKDFVWGLIYLGVALMGLGLCFWAGKYAHTVVYKEPQIIKPTSKLEIPTCNCSHRMDNVTTAINRLADEIGCIQNKK